MKTHLVVSIDGAIRRLNGTKEDRRLCLALFDRSNKDQLIVDLQEMKAKGLEVVPGNDCDNHSPTGECLGHPDKEPVK